MSLRQGMAPALRHGFDNNTFISPFRRFVASRVAVPNTVASTAIGIGAIVGSGTGTARVCATTNLFQSLARVGYVSGAVAGNVASLLASGTGAVQTRYWLGNAAGLGGFSYFHRFGVSDAVIVGTANMFFGLSTKSTSLPADVAPSTLVNQIGVGCDNGDTTLMLYASGAVAQARVSLGANFPVNTVNVDVYELQLTAAPFGSAVIWKVIRLNTGHTIGGAITAAANLPANTTLMQPQAWRSNGGAASAVGFDEFNLYVESGP